MISKASPKMTLWRLPSATPGLHSYHLSAAPPELNELAAALLCRQHAKELIRKPFFKLSPPPPRLLAKGEEASAELFAWLDLVTDPAFEPSHMAAQVDNEHQRCTIEMSRQMAGVAHVIVNGLLQGMESDSMPSSPSMSLTFWEYPS